MLCTISLLMNVSTSFLSLLFLLHISVISTLLSWEYVIVDGVGIAQQSRFGASMYGTPQFPGPRFGARMASLGPFLLLHGGENWLLGRRSSDDSPPHFESQLPLSEFPDPIPPLPDLWLFDPNIDRWTFLTVGFGTATRYHNTLSRWNASSSSGFPGSRGFHLFVSSENEERVYLYGGRGCSLSGCECILSDFWILEEVGDLESSEWKWRFLNGNLSECHATMGTIDHSVPFARYAAMGWSVGDDLFTWGGVFEDNVIGLNDSIEMFQFQFENSEWGVVQLDEESESIVPSLRSEASHWMTKDLTEARFFIFGGFDEISGMTLQDLFVFRLGERKWIHLASQYDETHRGSYRLDGLGFPGARAFGITGVFRADDASSAPSPIDYALLATGYGLGNMSLGEGCLGDTFWIDLDTLRWHWADIREDETFAYSSRASYSVLYPPSDDSVRPGMRWGSAGTVHRQSNSLYLFGGMNLCSAYMMMDFWRLSPLCNNTGRISDDPIHLACPLYMLCHPPSDCDCRPNHFPPGICDDWHCDGISRKNVSAVCFGHGICEGSDICRCESERYQTQFCGDWSCNGIWTSDTDDGICHGHGTCVDHDRCLCDSNWDEHSLCKEWTCGGIVSSEISVCSGHGICLAPGTCHCLGDTRGPVCDLWDCFGYDQQPVPVPVPVPDVCSGHGICQLESTGTTICVCDEGFSGDQCSNVHIPLSSGGLSAGGIAGIVVAVLVVFVCLVIGSASIIACLYRKDSTNHHANTSVLTMPLLFGDDNEQKSESLSIPHSASQIDVIPSEELVLQRPLAGGGSGSAIYKCVWKGADVVAKIFSLSEDTSQDDVDQLISEAVLMQRISNPNILKLYGIALSFRRLALVIEYAPAGDLQQYMFHRPEADPPLLSQRMKWLREIACGMQYLHSRSVIHRDLKPSNILLDSRLVCKLGDFGLSRSWRELELASKTKGVGTGKYMAPELVLGLDYDSSIDVFSFAILAYILLTNRCHPYGSISLVEYRVANDGLRPSLSEIADDVKLAFPQVNVLLQSCWSADPEKRLNFSQIVEMIPCECEGQELGEEIAGEICS